MNDNQYAPLKNKKWLFPETGKAGFHYDDINNAVAGLKKDLRKSNGGLHKEELLTLIEKWFPDVTEKKQYFLIKLFKMQKKTIIFDEKQFDISKSRIFR